MAVEGECARSPHPHRPSGRASEDPQGGADEVRAAPLTTQVPSRHPAAACGRTRCGCGGRSWRGCWRRRASGSCQDGAQMMTWPRSGSAAPTRRALHSRRERHRLRLHHDPRRPRPRRQRTVRLDDTGMPQDTISYLERHCTKPARAAAAGRLPRRTGVHGRLRTGHLRHQRRTVHPAETEAHGTVRRRACQGEPPRAVIGIPRNGDGLHGSADAALRPLRGLDSA